MKLGLIQVKQNRGEELEARQEGMLAQARCCYEDGADLVFFPEEHQYVMEDGVLTRPDELREITEKWKERCSALAREYSAYLVPWDYEVADGKIYNTSYVLDRTGRETGRFRKVHLPYFEQKKGISTGDDFPVFDLDFGKVGIMICWDNYFPESARILTNRGAELILFPLYGDTVRPGWEIKLRARAIDNAVYIASEQIDNVYTCAFSGVVRPDGEIVEKLTDAPAHRVLDIDLKDRAITHSTGDPNVSEDIGLYTAKCRNTAAYGGIFEKRDPSWDEVFLGKAPQ